jgi:CRISPR-associated protein Cas6
MTAIGSDRLRPSQSLWAQSSDALARSSKRDGVRMEVSVSYVDLYFQVMGEWIPLDHGYDLYAAICKATGEETSGSWFHAAENIGLIPIRGTAATGHRLMLDRRARFGLRLSAEQLPRALPLAGRRLRIGNASIRAGVPTPEALRPAGTLYARIVTTRNGEDPERFDAEIARQLAVIEVRGEPKRGDRRIVRIHDKKVVGHELQVTGLSDQDSIRLQEHGLGGRRKMGCGVFFPRSDVAGPALKDAK